MFRVPFLLLLAFCAPALGGLRGDALASLRGVQGVVVFVLPPREELPDPKDLLGHIQTDVELKLRQAGVKVVSAETAPFGTPALYVTLETTKRSGSELLGYSTAIELRQLCSLSRSPQSQLWVSTWRVENFGFCGSLKIADAFAELVNRNAATFVNDFLAANAPDFIPDPVPGTK